ncbi:MAG TPA: hypothetical protein VGQ99_18095 [Tepidisphaeraceae bacterium]|jgi:hypothetical protein|nr:hypothetical protein [Tepidisphaeraceae bacterium]HEV8607257.1 hypothetical protein [Tepidisphaeraceae bacterium]
MRFTVNGIWKITGQPTTVSIEATDSEAAAENAIRRGLDVKSVEKSRSIGPQLGPSVEEMDYARYVVSSRTSMGKILFGLLMAGLGIGATWYGYNIAANSTGGGHYTVYWGLVVFGLYTAFKGAASNSSGGSNEHEQY